MSNLDSMNTLLIEELRDLYDAERQLTRALPKMVKAAKSQELRNAFLEHLQATEQHVVRLEEALEALKRPSKVRLHTDSKYVMDGLTKWIHGWKKNGWKTADKKPVKNEDLWKRLDAANARHDVEWKWVKGHADDVMNNRADELARNAIASLR